MTEDGETTPTIDILIADVIRLKQGVMALQSEDDDETGFTGLSLSRAFTALDQAWAHFTTLMNGP